MMPEEIMLRSRQFVSHRNTNELSRVRRWSTMSDIYPCQIQTNLLEKSLSTRIKTNNLPVHDHKQDSGLLHLACLNKERNTFISLRGDQRLDSRSREFRNSIFRERLTRQRQYDRLKHPEKYDDSNLPDLDVGSIRSDSAFSKMSVKSLPVETITFGESDDHIGVVKRGGIFKYIHMYTPSRYQHKVQESPFKVPMIEFETMKITQTGCLSTDEMKSKRKKGLRVTFGGSQSDPCATDQRGDDNNKQKSPKAKSTLQKRSFILPRDEIPYVGVAWDISQNAVSKPPSNPSGHISRDLHPVTSGMTKAGISETKTRWRVSSCRYFNRAGVPLDRFHINRIH